MSSSLTGTVVDEDTFSEGSFNWVMIVTSESTLVLIVSVEVVMQELTCSNKRCD